MEQWLPLCLVVGVALLGVVAIIGTIRSEAAATRAQNALHAETVQARLAEIHLNTNSSLTSVRAALEQANLKIASLEGALVALADQRAKMAEQLKAKE